MLAAESALEEIFAESQTQTTASFEPRTYTDRIKNSFIWSELKAARNCRPSFHNPIGLLGGIMYSGVSLLIGGKEPWTFSHGGAYYNINNIYSSQQIFNLNIFEY